MDFSGMVRLAVTLYHYRASEASVLQKCLNTLVLKPRIPCPSANECTMQIDRRYHIPTNSVYLTSILAGMLCLINLGSSLAFNIIVSLGLLAILSTYTISIGCILLKRIRGQSLPSARWSLGRWGLPINVIGFTYSCFAFVFCCFPAALPVDPSTANWGPALWAAVVFIALLIYVFWGRKYYTPPVIFVEGVRESGMEFQSS